jgi:hypothetical protein
VGDPTEGSLLVSGSKVGLDRDQLEATHPRLDSIPFESEYQYMATLNQSPRDGARLIWMKGSVESLLKRSDSVVDSEGGAHPINKERLQQQADRMANLSEGNDQLLLDRMDEQYLPRRLSLRRYMVPPFQQRFDQLRCRFRQHRRRHCRGHRLAAPRCREHGHVQHAVVLQDGGRQFYTGHSVRRV